MFHKQATVRVSYAVKDKSRLPQLKHVCSRLDVFKDGTLFVIKKPLWFQLFVTHDNQLISLKNTMLK